MPRPRRRDPSQAAQHPTSASRPPRSSRHSDRVRSRFPPTTAQHGFVIGFPGRKVPSAVGVHHRILARTGPGNDVASGSTTTQAPRGAGEMPDRRVAVPAGRIGAVAGPRHRGMESAGRRGRRRRFQGGGAAGRRSLGAMRPSPHAAPACTPVRTRRTQEQGLSPLSLRRLMEATGQPATHAPCGGCADRPPEAADQASTRVMLAASGVGAASPSTRHAPPVSTSLGRKRAL